MQNKPIQVFAAIRFILHSFHLFLLTTPAEHIGGRGFYASDAGKRKSPNPQHLRLQIRTF